MSVTNSDLYIEEYFRSNTTVVNYTRELSEACFIRYSVNCVLVIQATGLSKKQIENNHQLQKHLLSLMKGDTRAIEKTITGVP